MTAQKSFRNALKWSFAGIWGERGLVAVFTVILAALLGPREFGLLTIAWIFVNFIQMFLDQGLSAALIQKQDLQQEDLDAVFWMDLGLSLVLIAFSVLLSHWWAAVNHAPKVSALISVLSLCIPIEALAVVQKAVLSRSMDFKSLSIRNTIAVLVGGITGTAMAAAKFGVWSLVGQQVVKDIVALALLWRLSSWRPRWRFSWPHLRSLMGFSLSNFAAQLGIFADTQTGSVLAGILFGPVPVGLYRLADRIMNSVVAACTSSIQVVSLPEFSRLQDDPAKLRESALLCIRLSSTITLPALAGIAAVSDSLMATLGPSWIPAADALKVLCMLGMVIIFAYFTGPLLQALAKPHFLAGLEWARTMVGICFLLVAGMAVRHSSVHSQVMALAIARIIPGALIVTPTFLFILMRLTRMSVRGIVDAILPSAASSFCVVVAILIVQSIHFLSTVGPPLLLTTETIAGLMAGLPVLVILDARLRRLFQLRFKRPPVSSLP
ncbi:MAG TPA: lipopolysaccharide biosynthesis protein [Terracidiphilus sp.]|nr:lipopolysaccharide biosynthesis protein [Terracidiphilus sp.]